jgi:hypothetical protein
LPKKADELFAWLTLPANAQQVVPLLAYCTAMSIDATSFSERERGRRGEDLAGTLKLDMSPRWTPKADGYLTRISSDQVIAAMAEAGANPIAIAEAQKLKKAELVAKALPILTKANWLPKPLRFPGWAKVASAPKRAKTQKAKPKPKKSSICGNR